MKFARAVFSINANAWSVKLGSEDSDYKFFVPPTFCAEEIARIINRSLARDLKAATVRRERRNANKLAKQWGLFKYNVGPKRVVRRVVKTSKSPI